MLTGAATIPARSGASSRAAGDDKVWKGRVEEDSADEECGGRHGWEDDDPRARETVGLVPRCYGNLSKEFVNIKSKI